MALINPPTWLEAGTYTAGRDRLVTGLLVDRNYDATGNITGLEAGVVGPKNQLVATANGTMNVSISAGLVIAPRTNVFIQEAYICANDGPVAVTVPVAASQQRNDILVARVNDSQDGNAGDNWEFHLVTGTLSGTPTDPAVPANYVKLYRINVKSAALNGGVDKIAQTQITDIRNFVAAPGGVHVAWNGAYPNSQPGRLVYDPTPGNAGTLKIGVGSGLWYTLIPDEYRALRAAIFGTTSIYHDATVYKRGSASGVWDATPLDAGTDVAIGDVSVDAAAQYGAAFKVTIAALAKCDDVDISGHLSVQVRDGSTEIYPPDIGKGPSFYGTFWVSSENSFLVALPSSYKQRSVNFRVMFRSNYSGSGSGSTDTVKFQRIRLIVEPLVV